MATTFICLSFVLQPHHRQLHIEYSVFEKVKMFKKIFKKPKEEERAGSSSVNSNIKYERLKESPSPTRRSSPDSKQASKSSPTKSNNNSKSNN